MKLNQTRFVKVISLLIILTSTFTWGSMFYAAVYANPVSPTVYLDDLPANAYYTVKSDGVNFWAIRYDGYKGYEDTEFYTVVNNAITATNTAGGGVVFLNMIGIFTVNSPIIMKSKVTLQGTGLNATILKAKADLRLGGIQASVIQTSYSTTPYTGITIRDLGIDGYESAQAFPDPDDYPCGIALFDTDFPIIQRIYAYNCKQYGIWVIASNTLTQGYIQGAEISSCIVKHADWDGIDVGSSVRPAYYCRIFGNYIEDSSDVGIGINGDKNIVYGNTLRHCNGHLKYGSANSGWGADIETGSYNIIADNYIYDCNSSIALNGGGSGGYNSVVGNFADTSWNISVLSNGDYNSVIGFRAINCKIKFIDVWWAADNNDFINCVCRDAIWWALYLSSGTSNTFIDGCDFKGCTYNLGDDGSSGTQYGFNRWANGTYGQGHP